MRIKVQPVTTFRRPGEETADASGQAFTTRPLLRAGRHHRLRKIRVDLPGEVHRKLRVKAALQVKSIRAFVAEVVGEAVKDVVIPTARPASRGRHE